MNNETILLLEKYFDVAFAAPDGVKKVRELILSLAMQGKLVPQDPSDQSARELLKEIDAEKSRLVKEGKIKASKPLPEIKPDEVPYDLPKAWEWIRIRNMCHDWGQKTPDSFFTYIDVGSIDNKRGVISDDVQLLESVDAPSRARKIVCKGTVIYSTVRPYLLNIAIVDKDFSPEPIASTAFAILHPFCEVSNRFIYYYLRSPEFISYVESTMKGVAYPAINDGDFFHGLFPLPPIAEQRRIVAKIDELMARCDELEKLRQVHAQKQITVHNAALNQLLTGKDHNDFKTSWHFITQHFGELYSVKANVTELRKAILQLAVMGKLVPQDPNDGLMSNLLENTRKQVSEIVLQKMGKTVVFEPIKTENKTFPLPSNWLWVKLGSILRGIKYGTSKKCGYEFSGSAVLRIPNIDVEHGRIDISDLKYTHLLESELEDLYLLSNDLLMIRSNGSKSLVGRTAVIGEAEEGLAYAGYLVRLRLFPEYIYSRYLHLALSTLFVREQIERPIRSTSGVKNINSSEIANLCIPLPPLAEQHRIVAKIDQLMTLCDELEKKIDAAESKQTNLLSSVMTKI